MKGLAKIIGCCWVLAALLAAAFPRANLAPAAWAENTPATSIANQSPQVPNPDDPDSADALHGQMQCGANFYPKDNAENDGLLSADISNTLPGNPGATGNSQAINENPDSPFEHYLLIVLAGGTLGLVLIAAGIAQWWRRQKIRQYWLFPLAQDDGEPAAPGASSPPPLIAKKPMEILPEEITDQHAHRRAAA